MKPIWIIVLFLVGVGLGYGLSSLIGSQKSAENEKTILELQLKNSQSGQRIDELVKDSVLLRREIDNQDSLIENQMGQLAKQTIQDEKDISRIRALPADETVRLLSTNFSAASR